MIERVLVAGLDAPDDVVLAEARRRRDAGQEVVLAGTGLDARQVAHIARAEDVHLVIVLISATADGSRELLTDALREYEVMDARLEVRRAGD